MVKQSIIIIIILLFCASFVSAEVGQMITFTSTATGASIPSTSSTSGGGSGGYNRNSNNCDTKVNATNIATDICGEYSVCYLPPRYNIVEQCVESVKYKIMPPPGTYNRGGIIFIDDPTIEVIDESGNEIIAEQVIIAEPIENISAVVTATLVKEGDENVEAIHYKLIGGVLFLLALFLSGVILLIRQLKKNKQKKNVAVQQPMARQVTPVQQSAPTQRSAPTQIAREPVRKEENYEDESWRDF